MKPQPLREFPDLLSRRMLLRAAWRGSLLGLGALALPGCSWLENFGAPASPETPGLGALARRKNRLYGAAVQSWQLDEHDFVAALSREAALLVPETELKWDILRPSQDTFDFTGYNKLADFAKANGMAMRGHVLLWHEANPAWLEPALARRGAAEKILEEHIFRVVGETSPFIRNWDVVNEAINPHTNREDGLRQTLWLRALGPDYVASAFRLAHQADPGLTLVYNDYGTEQGDATGNRKRQCILRLLEECAAHKVPVHAFGLQSHLQAHRPLAGEDFTAFLKEVRALGLKIFITEMDLDVSRLSGRADDKVKIAQNYVRKYLGMVQKDGPVPMLLTWGLSDRYTWLRSVMHEDVTGALPLDANYDRGPLWETLKKAWL